MPSFSESRILPYYPDQLYDLVMDIRKYPKFLPWCVAARIKERHDDGVTADVLVGYQMFRETWTSRVYANPYDSVRVEYLKGPFKHLHNQWWFEQQDGQSTKLTFDVSFEFAHDKLEKAASFVFEETCHRMVQSFEDRAKILYAPLEEI